MDLVDIKKEKLFFGQEFLTWIWYRSEINSGLIDLPGFGAVEIWFIDRLVLESGQGDQRQAVTCQGKELDLAEARTALKEGKKVSQARIRVGTEGLEWRFTLKAEGLDISGLKAPPTLDPDEEESENDAGRLLDRIVVTRELTRIIDELYARFLAVRLTEAWSEKELPRLRRWLKETD